MSEVDKQVLLQQDLSQAEGVSLEEIQSLVSAVENLTAENSDQTETKVIEVNLAGSVCQAEDASSQEVPEVESIPDSELGAQLDSQLVSQLDAELNTNANSENSEQETDVASFTSAPCQAFLEAVMIAFGEAVSVKKLSQVTGFSDQEVKQALEQLKERYQANISGIELIKVADQFQIRTKANFAEAIRLLKGSSPRRLSAAALETLAVVAYRQPIVKSDIERIRGVDVAPTLKTLMDRALIKIVGHQSTVGQPALYGTTDEFLKLFGLSSLRELPTLKDLKEFEKEPGESQEIGAD